MVLKRSISDSDRVADDPPAETLGVGGTRARAIAYRRRPGRAPHAPEPGLVWLCGFGSDMRGTKARFLDRAAAEHGLAFLRFDYSGHGESGGRFEEGTIGLWLEEALAAIESRTTGRQVLVGSSMGAWIALLVAEALAVRGEEGRLAGLVLLAPAVDFTEVLVWERMDSDARAALETSGIWQRPSAYASAPFPITRQLIEEGRRHLLLGTTIRSYCPVHIIHGRADPDVPWQHAAELVAHLAGDPVTLTLVADGDHRLSRDADLALLRKAVMAMIAAETGPVRSGAAAP